MDDGVFKIFMLHFFNKRNIFPIALNLVLNELIIIEENSGGKTICLGSNRHAKILIIIWFKYFLDMY